MTQALRKEVMSANETADQKFGWRREVVEVAHIVETVRDVVARMDALAEKIGLLHDEQYQAERHDILMRAENLQPGESVTALAEQMAKFRMQLMFFPLERYKGNSEKLRMVAKNLVDEYEIASEDPIIEKELDELRQTVVESDVTAIDLEMMMKAFIKLVPAFRDSNTLMLGELIESMHHEAKVFGFADDPELVEFFHRFDIAIAGAVRPDEFLAVSEMLNEFEPKITKRVVDVAPIDILHTFTLNVINGVQQARREGLSFGSDAEARLDHAYTELNRGILDREDYRKILRGIRELHVES